MVTFYVPFQTGDVICSAYQRLVHTPRIQFDIISSHLSIVINFTNYWLPDSYALVGAPRTVLYWVNLIHYCYFTLLFLQLVIINNSSHFYGYNMGSMTKYLLPSYSVTTKIVRVYMMQYILVIFYSVFTMSPWPPRRVVPTALKLEGNNRDPKSPLVPKEEFTQQQDSVNGTTLM